MCKTCNPGKTHPPKGTRSDGPNRRQFLNLSLVGTGLFGLATTATTSTIVQAQATEMTPFGTPMPGPHDACPVCGMFPHRYPDWIATVLYKDGHADHFDGAKDLFKYLLDMDKYASGRKAEDIIKIGVTDYYATEMIDARSAYFVIGSDVMGPMGHELIPHPDEYDTREFAKDHFGKRILRFGDVTMEILLGLDRGEFVLE